MNTEYIQNLRYKLQRRTRRVLSSDYVIYHSALRQYWKFLNENVVFSSILNTLTCRLDLVKNDVDEIINHNGKNITIDNEEQQILVSCLLIQECVKQNIESIEAKIAQSYTLGSHLNGLVEFFGKLFVEPLYEYLDEQLDDKGTILSLLRRYKHKCEWFQRDNLLRLWQDNTQKGEKLLASNLYEYLHDQGLDFKIEPSSISGEVDLIADQHSDDPLIADVKIFNPDKSKGVSYICSGFRQVYQYTLDYNEAFGYLVIFNTSATDLRFALRDSSQNTSFIIHNGKTIFFLIIDISEYEKSASKRGQLKTITITEEQLIQHIGDAGLQPEPTQQDDENNHA